MDSPQLNGAAYKALHRILCPRDSPIQTEFLLWHGGEECIVIVVRRNDVVRIDKRSVVDRDEKSVYLLYPYYPVDMESYNEFVGMIDKSPSVQDLHQLSHYAQNTGAIMYVMFPEVQEKIVDLLKRLYVTPLTKRAV
tara:strand:- start:1370 stop:1780 length:411 start_codon:yes stop_codon:yes gene_type:complete